MRKVEFKSKDRLLISADYYEATGHKGIILLCHRSHCNRAEYRETAPKFNALGYSCLAIDQRSGMKVFGESNETKDRAKAQKLATGYLDAKPDIEAAIDYAYTLNHNQPIILLGSSYSAALSLLIAKDSNKLKSLILFSPGEHLKGVNLAVEIESISIPVFAASAKKEIQETT
jgi:alpha-beta hydrolase superfamily lysophospholipase